MIVDRYLISEIVKPLAPICAMLIVIFVSYSLSVYLADAANGLLPVNMILQLVLLKTTIALEVLLPIALYLSVVVALGRLYSDYEMVALAAAGVSNGRILAAVFRLCLIVAISVGSLSLYLRPWAYQQSYLLRAHAEAEIEIDRLESSQFYNSAQAKRTVFVERIDPEKTHLERVFIQNERDGASRVIYAERAYEPKAVNGRELVFLDGYVYDLDRDGGQDRILKFGELTLQLKETRIDTVDHRRKAMPTIHLAYSAEPKDIAELQWRLSTPLNTVLLGLLAVPLSRTVPRQGKYAKLLAAVLIYAVFYNLSALAKTWVEQGIVPPLPGIWWANGSLAGLLAILLGWPSLRRRFK